MRVKKWHGSAEKCDICNNTLTGQPYFVDGMTRQGMWALMCPVCHKTYGCGTGLGRGQKYNTQTKELIEGVRWDI